MTWGIDEPLPAGTTTKPKPNLFSKVSKLVIDAIEKMVKEESELKKND